MPAEGRPSIYLWDLPVRVTHWAFVLLLPAMWWTAEEGHMDRHKQIGMIVLGLLAFRILWGIFGSAPARFGQFVKGPVMVLAYLRAGAAGGGAAGHSPIGGWSVVALFALLALQIGLGLIAQDVDGLFSGPLNHLVAYETGDAAREWHELTFNILLALVAVHIAAIAFYLVVRKINLIAPMLSGRKAVGSAGAAEPQRGTALAFVLAALAAVGLVSWVWFGAPPLGQ